MDSVGHIQGSKDRLGAVVELLYDAALDDSKWQSVAISVAEAFASSSAVVKTCGESGPQLESVTANLRISPENRSWNEYWHSNDLWVNQASTLDLGDVFTSQRLVSEAEFERSGFYQDWTRRLDVYHMVGVLFPGIRGETAVLGVHRPKHAAPFGEADCRRLGELFPHVRRALGLREKLRGAGLPQQAALAALDCLDTGVLVVDASCTLIYANRAADHILASTREVHTRARRLHISDAALDARLFQLVRGAAQVADGKLRRPGSVIAVRRPDRLPLTLLVSPWRAAWAPGDVAQPAAMIFIRDPERRQSTSAQTLRELFGMTRAEAAIAVAIGEGQSLEQIAAALGVGLGTVRTHLKKALAKTGTNRQAGLAALVSRSVAGIATPI